MSECEALKFTFLTQYAQKVKNKFREDSSLSPSKVRLTLSSENSYGQRLRRYMREKYNKTGDHQIFREDAVATAKFFLDDLQLTNPQAEIEITSFKTVIEFLEGVDLEQESVT